MGKASQDAQELMGWGEHRCCSTGEMAASDAWAAEKQSRGTDPLSQTNLCPCAKPRAGLCQSGWGMLLPEGWQGLPVVWKCCKAQLSQMNMCTGPTPAMVHMFRRIWQQRWYPGSGEPVPGSPLGNRVNNKIPDASASLAALPSVKQKVFPPLPYLGVGLLGLGSP